MKTVFTNSEVPHIWAQQNQPSGRGSNIFFEGETIYSYGRHFPMATIKGNDVFFTKRSYSVSTGKHLSRTQGAISHKNIIWVYEVPVGDFKYLTSTHEKNMAKWKQAIKTLFEQLGNKKNRDVQGRINLINRQIEQLNIYCAYFKLKVKDSELKSLLKIATAPDFVEQARTAKEKENAANEKKMKQAAKAYDQYISLWRDYKDEEIKELPAKIKDLCNLYRQNQQSFTRLRFNSGANRLETSKGVQIPAEIAKRAYIQLNGCMEGSCKDISVPVMDYTITETGKDYIKAGCHTIPKSDVQYIANLLNW
jgi:hypothetical protein